MVNEEHADLYMRIIGLPDKSAYGALRVNTLGGKSDIALSQ